MSWIEQIETNFTITTGDGRVFNPKWMNAEREIPYNTTEFTFPNVPGSFLDRREPKGTKYKLEFHFDGDDHLDVAQSFVASAADKRYWIIAHPFYGSLNVQPLSLKQDNKDYNVSKFLCPVIETLTERYPKATIIPEDKIDTDAEEVDESSSENFALNVDPSPADLNTMEFLAEDFYLTNAPIISEPEDAQGYFNLFNEASATIRNAESTASQKIRSIQRIIQAPVLFSQSVQTRIEMLKNNFNTLINMIQGTTTTAIKLTNPVRNMFETLGSTVITSMCNTSAQPFDDSDYENRVQVSEVIDELNAIYDQYAQSLDGLEVGNGANPEDYISDADSITALNNVFLFTISNLFDIGFEARQERILTLENDTNLIVLSHRLYGPDPDDENIEQLVNNNMLGLDDILNLKKGKEIVYYI